MVAHPQKISTEQREPLRARRKGLAWGNLQSTSHSHTLVQQRRAIDSIALQLNERKSKEPENSVINPATTSSS